jgi:flagellar biogenesis protein FliO
MASDRSHSPGVACVFPGTRANARAVAGAVRLRFFCIGFVSVFVLVAPAFGGPASVESEKLQIDPAAVAAAKSDGMSAVATQSGNDMLRVLLALGAVIALIFLLKKIATRSGWFAPVLKQGKSIRVISRSTLAPRQQVLLIQVGRRLIVVGDCGGSLTSLAQITEPDEVAALVGEAASNTSTANKQLGFAGMFKKANRPFDADVTADEMPALTGGNIKPSDEEPAPEDVGGLLEAVRAMRRQFKQTG